MNVYFSGLGGVGIGPLAQIANSAGYYVTGSDAAETPVVRELREQGVVVNIGQDGQYLRESHQETPFSWFVYTSALPSDHPELVLARGLGIKTSKRDEFLSELLKESGLKLIAVSGTHGKTTATGMFIWTLKQLGIPVSYSVGSTISFGPSGHYDPDSEYFIYECDEFDRNFLNFTPFLSILTSFDYDHPDTYPTRESYSEAFQQFSTQSEHTILWGRDKDATRSGPSTQLSESDELPIKLPGKHNRQNATLVVKAIERLGLASESEAIEAVESFPGTDRRFEKLADNLYSDYGHHPVEIAATLELASELSDDVVLVYQPHQNQRQHTIKDQYLDQFEVAKKIYWLPTFLTREKKGQSVLSPEELTKNISNRNDIEYSDLNPQLWSKIERHLANGSLVLCMGAGSIDPWLRTSLLEMSQQTEATRG